MKKFSKIVIVLAFVLSLAFAALGRNTEISDCELVSAVAIDKTDGLWQITAEICKPSKEDPLGSKSEYVKGEGFSLSDAFSDASLKMDKVFFTDATRLYVISDSLTGDSELKNYFTSNDVNMRAVTLYCEKKAENVLNPKDSDKTAKGITLTDRIRRFCFENKITVPKVSSLLKENCSVWLKSGGIPERSDGK